MDYSFVDNMDKNFEQKNVKRYIEIIKQTYI